MSNQRRKGRVKKRFKSERGFTLVEILVAAMLLLFAMAGIVPFFLGGLSQASSVRYKSLATNIARERMEQIRQLDYREITEDSAEGETLTERFGPTAVQRDITFDVSYLVEEASYEEGIVKKVTVNVDWVEPPAVSAASITTLIHQQFLGPRGALLVLDPTEDDDLGTPFPLIGEVSRMVLVRYYLAEADWGLVYDNLNDPATRTARNVYMRLVLYDDEGQSYPVGDPANDYKIDSSYLVPWDEDSDGLVDYVYFEYPFFDSWSIPDGYWEIRAVVYNQYDQPGNVWRLRVRIEQPGDQGNPAPPVMLTATPQADNETVILTWLGGSERDRDHFELERSVWDGADWSGWTPLAGDLDPKTTSYTDSGSVGTEEDPWGNTETKNKYLYRVRAVDRSSPKKVGNPAQAEAEVPSPTTTLPPSTTTTSTVSTSTTDTTLASYSVMIENVSRSHYNVKIYDNGDKQVFNGNVSKGDTATVSGLKTGNYLITATSPGKPTINQSFSLPAQNGQIVLTIF